jgi:MscS family membrane protein
MTRRIPAQLLARLVPVAFCVFFLLGLALAWPGGAQDTGQVPQATTPRQAVHGFLSAGREANWERAARFLDLSQVDAPPGSDDARGLARDLKVVLDRTVWIDLSTLSDSPDGSEDDDLDADLERVCKVPTPQGDVGILLQRSGEGEARHWLFAPHTVAAIPGLYATHGHGWVEELLPDVFFDFRVLEIELWQWLGLLVAVVLASILGFVATTIVHRCLKVIVSRTQGEWDDVVLARALGPLRFGLSLLAFYGLAHLLALNAPVRNFLGLACKALSVLTVTWLILRLIDVVSQGVHRKLAQRDVNAADTLVPMGRRATKIFVVGIALLSLIHNLGFNVAGILAGLGVGGLAVALAAQKTLENLFGGITIIADRPVEVGETCKVGDHFGTVEAIGMRSTRLRTLDRTLVTIANAEFSTVRIENYSVRDRIRLYAVLQVGYDTTPDQMRYLIAELRRVMEEHPKVLPDPRRVRFTNLNAYSLDLEVFAYIDTKDGSEFLSIREELYLRFMEVVAASGAYFAYPSQTLYLGRDGGRDLERSEQAERQAREWREAAKNGSSQKKS